MERRGNIILVGDDNMIMESARHITPRHEPSARCSRTSPMSCRQHRTSAIRTTPRAEGIRALLVDGAQQPLWRALVGTYRGLAPLAAREAVFRATGQADAPLAPDLPWEQIAAAVRDLWGAPWQPCLVFHGAAPTVFAPYPLTHLAPFEPSPRSAWRWISSTPPTSSSWPRAAPHNSP